MHEAYCIGIVRLSIPEETCQCFRGSCCIQFKGT